MNALTASQKIVFRLADYANDSDAACVVQLLDEYSLHPMGDGRPLPSHIRQSLIGELSEVPGAFSVLGFIASRPIALANCLTSFSSFNVAPRINVHDLYVRDSFRGCGVGRLLLQAVREEAERRRACAVTLEVRHDNVAACHLYASFGFEGIGKPTEPIRSSGKEVHFFGVLPLGSTQID